MSKLSSVTLAIKTTTDRLAAKTTNAAVMNTTSTATPRSAVSLVKILCTAPFFLSLVDAAEFDDLTAERDELNCTVWSHERAAQQHETVFIELWDRLRSTPDVVSVLSAFPFDELRLATALTDGERFDWGISQKRTDGQRRAFDRSDWLALVIQWQEEGFSLEQSEWHHKRFIPAAQSPSRSLIDVTLHVSDTRGDRRLIISGDLQVTWSGKVDDAGHPVPATIDATQLTLTERHGTPAFVEVDVLEAGALLAPLVAADLDIDGSDDVLAFGSNTLYHNHRSYFESAELLSGPPPGNVEVASVADFTGDGLLDAIVGGPKQLPGLYEGSVGGFEKQGVAILTRTLAQPKAMTAGDTDSDGDLDLWVGQYKVPYVNGQMPTPYYDANDGYPAYLLRNEGGGRFTDVTTEMGLAEKRHRRTYSASFADLDTDGDLDLLVVSDFAGIDLYYNEGDGRFEDVTPRLVGETSTFGMSHAFGDYDNDGRLDIYVVGMSSTTARRLDHLGVGRDDFPDHHARRSAMGFGNRMYLASDDGSFLVAPETAQVARTGWSWGVASSDLDNDGDDEIYVANGHMSGDSALDYCSTFWTHDIYTGSSQPDPKLASFFNSVIGNWHGSGKSWNGFEHNKLFLDTGASFVEIGFLMGLAFEFDARTVLDMDVDGDGRRDLLVSEWSGAPKRERVHVMLNRWPGGNNWIGVRLRNVRGLSPIGASITLYSALGAQVEWLYTGESFTAQHSSTRNFGLGKVEHVDSLVVTWPDGRVSSLFEPEINRYHELVP